MTSLIDQRPPVAVGHVRLAVKDVGAAARWLETVGLRPIVTRDELAVLELRGGTHVVVRNAAEPPQPGAPAPFDLMVDDVDAAYRDYAEKGLSPAPIRRGPLLTGLREINPAALGIAASLDRIKPSPTQPLAGIPILLKDNIATGDQQHTTAGSLALAEARAKRDAALVARLRAAGAVILGKANLTEFANTLAIDMPAGYSALGGQVRNPHAPELARQGVPP